MSTGRVSFQPGEFRTFSQTFLLEFPYSRQRDIVQAAIRTVRILSFVPPLVTDARGPIRDWRWVCAAGWPVYAVLNSFSWLTLRISTFFLSGIHYELHHVKVCHLADARSAGHPCEPPARGGVEFCAPPLRRRLAETSRANRRESSPGKTERR